MKQDATESAATADTAQPVPAKPADPISEYLDVAALGMRVLATVLDAANLAGSDIARQWLSEYELLAARAKELEEFVDLVERLTTYKPGETFLREKARALKASRSRTVWRE
jgi:hypothetical protein